MVELNTTKAEYARLRSGVFRLFLSKNLKKGDGCMKNPVAIYTKTNKHEDFVMISGFVKRFRAHRRATT